MTLISDPVADIAGEIREEIARKRRRRPAVPPPRPAGRPPRLRDLAAGPEDRARGIYPQGNLRAMAADRERTQQQLLATAGDPNVDAPTRDYARRLAQAEARTPLTPELASGLSRAGLGTYEPLRAFEQRAAPVVGKGLGAAVRGLAEAEQLIPERLRAQSVGPRQSPEQAQQQAEQIGERAFEIAFPTQGWEVALEIFPGVGSVPGGASFLRKELADLGFDLTPASIRAFGKSEAGQRFARALTAGESGEFKFSFLDRKLKESREIIQTYDETLKMRGLGAEKRIEIKAERAVARQRAAILDDIRKRNRQVPDLERRVLGDEDAYTAGSLAREREEIEDELRRRAIPFGERGQPGMRPKDLANQRGRGRRARWMITNAYPELDTPTLNARRDAIEQLEAELPEGVRGAPAPAGLASATGGPPPEPPVLGGEPPLPPERPPTIREIEARSIPLTPEQRARLPRDQQEAIFAPREFTEATEDVTRGATGPIGGGLQKIQDAGQRIPVIRSILSFAEPMAAARAQRAAGNLIPEAMVRRAVFIDEEKRGARVAFMGWLSDNGEVLGLDGKGIARNVPVQPGAKIPDALRGRLDDIVEHAEDYILSPEQETAIRQLSHTFNAVTQKQLETGVDVREIMAAYFPRVVKKGPKGEPRGRGFGLAGRPGHAKPRAFGDLREGAATGYEYISPIDAIQHRLDTGIESIGNRQTFATIRGLGEKPSERVPQSLRDAVNDAREAYKAARTPVNEKRLEDARRALRVAATKANEPRMGEQKAFGRIFPEQVTDEIAKYSDIDDPASLNTFFRIQRATSTSSDLSALLVQGGNLFYRNNLAWWKAAGYSIAALAREPLGYVSRNIDSIQRGIKAGAISPPSEFLLRGGPTPVERVGRLPVVKQFQRSFEWFVFVGQSEWWKAAERMGMSVADQKELAAVIRKGTGSMLRPGMTRAQRQVEIGTFFAGKFLMAVNGLAADALRGGVRGAEARKTLGMVIGGATALTVAGQLATDGTLPNLTDPDSRDKPWLSVKRPGGTVNLFGPLYPYIRAYASIGQKLAEGKPGAAADNALFLGRTRLSVAWGTLIDFIEGKDAVGNEIDRDDPKSVAAYLARRTLPFGPREAAEGGLEGQREFPEGNISVAGGRTSRATPYRQAFDEAGKKIKASGNWRAALSVEPEGNTRDIIKYQGRQEFKQAIGDLPQGPYIVPGTEKQRPRIEFKQWDRIEKRVANGIAEAGYVPKGDYANMAEAREAYIDRLTPALLKRGIGLSEARDRISADFDNIAAVKAFAKYEKAYRLAFWREHPDLLDDAQLLDYETTNEAEEKMLEEAGLLGR